MLDNIKLCSVCPQAVVVSLSPLSLGMLCMYKQPRELAIIQNDMRRDASDGSKG